MKEKLIDAIKKQQREILFGLKGYVTKEAGLCMNAFCGKEEKDIQKDKPYAKKIYREVFLSHLNFVYNTYGSFGDLIPDKRMRELIV